jgi:chitin disaccharide deacetylase
MRYLIINTDGYGFTAGITRAVEECIEFGTVRSLSANVNFKHADGLARLVRKHPEISVGCHLNPVVGGPVLGPEKVPTLVDEQGQFHYTKFRRRFLSGKIRLSELRAELLAQVDKTRDLAGKAFSHVDFHMGLHKIPILYGLFLEIAEKSGVGRIRGYRYLVGMEHQFPRLRHFMFLSERPIRIPRYLIQLWQWRKALRRGLATTDHWVGITYLGERPDTITIENYVKMLQNLPEGFNEFVAHPGYVDEDLKRWASYLDQRILEREILLSHRFRDMIRSSNVHLAGYRDIPVTQSM